MCNYHSDINLNGFRIRRLKTAVASDEPINLGQAPEIAQDAVGSMVDGTLVYVDVTPLLTRAALTGDVTAAQGSNTTTIANNAVSFAKFQTIATDSILGRDTAGTGNVENILLNATLSMDGSGNLQRAALTGNVTAPAGSNTTTIASGVVTEAMQVLADNTTQNVTSTAHGYTPKSPGDATKFLNGDVTPSWSVPAGIQTPQMIAGSVYDIADFWGGYRQLFTTSGTHTANKMYLYPFLCQQTVTITKFSFQVITAVGGSNARCGIYADSAGVPTGAALVDSGNMSTASAVVVDSGTVSYQLVAGTTYWWAVAVSANVAFNAYNGTWVPTTGAATTGDSSVYNAYRMDHTFGALPTIGTLTRVQVTAPPRLQIKL